MASRKTYLYGLGSGLIAGALLLQLASIGETSVGLSDAELEAAAAASGFVLKDANVAWYNEDEVNARIEKAVEQARSEAAPATPPAEAPAQEAPQAAPSDAPSPMVYAFTVAPGTELTTVAKLLYELGLVSDYNGFLLEMKERGLAGKIQAKHYRFDAVPTMDELIEALITP